MSVLLSSLLGVETALAALGKEFCLGGTDLDASFKEALGGFDADAHRRRRVVVYIGDDRAKSFGARSIPFDVPRNVACSWNSLFVKDGNTVTAVSGTTINGVRGVWAIDGRLRSSQSAPEE